MNSLRRRKGDLTQGFLGKVDEVFPLRELCRLVTFGVVGQGRIAMGRKPVATSIVSGLLPLAMCEPQLRDEVEFDGWRV